MHLTKFPLVQWTADDGGVREGRLVAIGGPDNCDAENEDDVLYLILSWEQYGSAFIIDTVRSERHIVPLSQVTLVPMRCKACGGEGVVDTEVTMGGAKMAGKTTCTTCKGTGKAGG